MKRFAVGWKTWVASGALVVVLALAGGAWWAATGGVKRALESQKVRVLVGQKTAGVLNAPSGYGPFAA